MNLRVLFVLLFSFKASFSNTIDVWKHELDFTFDKISKAQIEKWNSDNAHAIRHLKRRHGPYDNTKNLAYVKIYYKRPSGTWDEHVFPKIFVSGWNNDRAHLDALTLGDVFLGVRFSQLTPVPNPLTRGSALEKAVLTLKRQGIDIGAGKSLNARNHVHSEQAWLSYVLKRAPAVDPLIKPTVVVINIVSFHSECSNCRSSLLRLLNNDDRMFKKLFLRRLFPNLDDRVDVTDRVKLHIIYTSADIPPNPGPINLNTVRNPRFISCRR